jgi:hypothetical protein
VPPCFGFEVIRRIKGGGELLVSLWEGEEEEDEKKVEGKS